MPRDFEDYIESLYEAAFGDGEENFDDLDFWEGFEDFINALYEEYNDAYSEA